MIVYFDTSAFLPILVQEPASPTCRDLWREADSVISTRLLQVETASAIERARRARRIGPRQAESAISRARELWKSVRFIEVDRALSNLATGIAWRHGLRGYDATHCAAAVMFQGAGGFPATGLVAASGDRKLTACWRELGLATVDPVP